MKKISIIFLIFLLVTGCGSKYEYKSAEIGTGRDNMKQSKCVCTEFYKDGVWLR